MSYLISEDELIEVPIYIDIRNFSVLSDSCTFTQGEPPCMGDPSEPCGKKYSKCNHPNKNICTDLIGYYKSSENDFPEWVKEEKTYWRKPTWGIERAIEKLSSKKNSKGQTELDEISWVDNRIRFLLRDWTLKETNPELALEFKKVGDEFDPNLDMVSLQTWLVISNRLRPGILRAAYRALMNYEEEGEDDENFTKDVSPTSKAKTTNESDESSEDQQ